MRAILSLVFVASVFSANTVLAQSGPLTGTWAINLPQVSGFSGNLPWVLNDAGATFNGTMVLNVQSVAEVDGVMTGRQIFGTIYVADASFTAKVLVPGLPVPIPALPTAKALLFVNGNTMTGLALQSLNGTPVGVISVRGTRTGP